VAPAEAAGGGAVRLRLWVASMSQVVGGDHGGGGAVAH
jgi:hypothetical protein